jgi:hypothetical protein
MDHAHGLGLGTVGKQPQLPKVLKESKEYRVFKEQRELFLKSNY